MNLILNKAESYNLYEKGAFGNKLRIWNDIESLLQDSYDGTVTIRYIDGYNKWCQYNVKQNEINNLLDIFIRDGANIDKFRFNESAPDDCLIIQGEFCESNEYKYILSYSTDKVKMRDAMQYPNDLLGINAFHLMQKYLSKESMRNLKRLLATHPQAVIEFSVYDYFLGDIPENNTIFWEVRNY